MVRGPRPPGSRPALLLDSTDAAKHLLQRLPQDEAAFAKELHFLGPEVDGVAGQAAAAADDRGDTEGHIADIVAAGLHGRYRQDAALERAC